MSFSLLFQSVPKNMLHGELFDIELPTLVGKLVRIKVEIGGEQEQYAHLYVEVDAVDGESLCGKVVSQWARKPEVLRVATKEAPVGMQVAFERKHILYVGA